MAFIHQLRFQALAIALVAIFRAIIVTAEGSRPLTPGIRLPRLTLLEALDVSASASAKPINDGGEYFIEVSAWIRQCVLVYHIDEYFILATCGSFWE